MGMPWNSRKWTRLPEYKLLQALRPIPRDDSVLPNVVNVDEPSVDSNTGGQGLVRSSSAPCQKVEPKPAKPRTRSERLKIQREKKAAFKKKRSSLKSVVPVN